MVYSKNSRMNGSSISVRLIFAISLALLAPRLWAQDGLKGALSQANVAAFGSTLAIADFDNDNKPDGAVLMASGWPQPRSNFRIDLHFTGRDNAELAFESSERALTVTARDVDHDGDIDVIVEEAFTHRPLHVWINEGHGDFREGRVQDFPSLALQSDQHIESPPNQTDGLALCLPPQRGFEIAVLTTPLLSRPPSTDKSVSISTDSSFTSCTRAANSSRAPPLI